MALTNTGPALSFWEKEVFFQKPDVLIIGSGIVGLNAALQLKDREPGLKIAILEKGSLPAGASSRNAGFACFGSPTELLADIEKEGADKVWTLVEKRWKGLQALKTRLGTSRLGLAVNGGYELFRPEDENIYEACCTKLTAFNQEVKSITGKENAFYIASKELNEFGFLGVAQLIGNRAEGQIHTGKMIAALLALAREKGIAIYNGLEIVSWEEYEQYVQVSTHQGWQLKAKQVLFATNGFSKRFFPELDIVPARNQVLITQPIEGLRFKGCFHYEQGYYYFRNVGHRVLLGGGRNLDLEGEQTTQFGFTAPIKSALIKMLEQVILPGQPFEIAHWWSGILGVGQVKQPIIQAISDRVFVSIRLGGMGVAIGTLIGEEAANLCLSKR